LSLGSSFLSLFASHPPCDKQAPLPQASTTVMFCPSTWGQPTMDELKSNFPPLCRFCQVFGHRNVKVTNKGDNLQNIYRTSITQYQSKQAKSQVKKDMN
jgi:hypothetical protein